MDIEVVPTNEDQNAVDLLSARRMRRYADRVERQSLGGLPGRSHEEQVGDHDPLVADAVVQAKRGDQDAIRFLYTRYAENVHSYALSMVRNDHEAEDITQQVFTKVLSNLHRYEPRGVPFAAWIVRMARNAAIDHMRERRQIPCEEIFGPDEASDDDGRERCRDLRAALVRLPDDQRQVVLLRHLVGLSPREIGSRLGRSEASIHGLNHRGRRALQRELIELEATPALA